MIINSTNLEKIRKTIRDPKTEKPIIVQAQDDKFNRKILETGGLNVLLSVESGKRKDKPKLLDSGLNHVLAKIATKNKVSIGINIEEIQKLPRKDKAKRLARIKQNLKVSRKGKNEISVLNYKDKKNSSSLLLSLGASTKQAKEAF